MGIHTAFWESEQTTRTMAEYYTLLARDSIEDALRELLRASERCTESLAAFRQGKPAGEIPIPGFQQELLHKVIRNVTQADALLMLAHQEERGLLKAGVKP